MSYGRCYSSWLDGYLEILPNSLGKVIEMMFTKYRNYTQSERKIANSKNKDKYSKWKEIKVWEIDERNKKKRQDKAILIWLEIK